MTVVAHRVARPGRWAELGLTVIAVLIGVYAFVEVELGISQKLPSKGAVVAGILAVVALAAHLAIRKLAPYADPVFFPVALTLNVLGLAMIYRIDHALGKNFAMQQAILTIVGLVLMVGTLVALRDHRKLRRITYSALIASIVLLLLPMVPGLGFEVYGARLWINIVGFSFQPAELAKITLAVFFAGYLVVQRDNLSLAGRKILGLQLPRAKHFLPILVTWIACLGVLAMEKDFGTAMLFFGLFVAMLYVATERISWILIGGILSAVGAVGIVRIMPHIQARITIWLHALDPAVYDAKHGSYQLVQGMFGMAAGGLFGTGLGQGHPTKSFAANSDFIFASLSEELGLTGGIAILCLFLILVIRALRTGLALRDGFGKLLATGLGSIIALQCFVVVGGVTRVIPLTGLALPFLALGGSALLTNWIIIGLLLRMSDDARRPRPRVAAPLPDLHEFPGDDAATPHTTTSSTNATEVVS